MFLTYSGVGGSQGLPPTRMRTNYKKSSELWGATGNLEELKMEEGIGEGLWVNIGSFNHHMISCQQIKLFT